MNLKGVIFDLDGVLADTENLKAEAHSKTTHYLGQNVNKNLYIKVMGKSFTEVAKTFMEKGNLSFPIGEYRNTFNKQYKKMLQKDVRIKNGAKIFLRTLSTNQIEMVLVTSSEKWMADLILNKTNIYKYFKSIISSEDIKEEKPSPEPYLEAIRKIELNVNECVAFEDSETGIISASAAGLIVYGLRHRYNANHDFSMAKDEYNSFNDINFRTLL